MSLVLRAKGGDAKAREDLLARFGPFVAAQAAKASGHFVRAGEDDEYSVALIAFNEAVDAYDPERGIAFLAFSETVIRRRLIDFYRRRHQAPELPLTAFDTEDDEGRVQNRADAAQAMAGWQAEEDARERREEIEAFTQALERLGVSFAQLVAASPKHRDTRQAALSVARTLCEREDLIRVVEREGRLPMNELAKIVPVSRKTLERQRKYILAVALAMRGDFPYLKGYFR